MSPDDQKMSSDDKFGNMVLHFVSFFKIVIGRPNKMSSDGLTNCHLTISKLSPDLILEIFF